MRTKYIGSQELPDPTPIAVPIGYKRPPTIHDQVKAAMRVISLQAESEGFESEDEANDFEIDEDGVIQPTSYELAGLEIQDMPEDQSFGQPAPMELPAANSATGNDDTSAPSAPASGSADASAGKPPARQVPPPARGNVP